MGRDSPDRSPSPCPLDTFKAEKDRTVKRESTRLATQELLPSSEYGPAARNIYLEPVPTERALGKRPEAITEEPSFSGPIKQEMDSENELFVPNEVSVNDSTYASKLAP